MINPTNDPKPTGGYGGHGGDDVHDTDPPGVQPDAVKAGHESDRFEAQKALYVPAIVVVTVLTAIGIISAIFAAVVYKPAMDPAANQESAAEATRPLNSRFGQISSTDPNAPVKQPRLEYLKQTATEGDRDPAWLRPKRPIEAVGATWEIRPEDLRPENFVDPTLKRKILVEAGWRDADTKNVAHIPLAVAMDAVLAKLPIRKDPVVVSPTSDGKPKLSNSGRGGPAQVANAMRPVEAGAKTEPKAPPHQ